MPVSPSTDSLTVLRVAEGRRAAKRVSSSPGGGVLVEEYNAGAVFTPETIPVSGIGDLAGSLFRLAGDPTRLVIRGSIASNRRPRKDGTIFRRKVKGAWQGFITDHARHWFLVDVGAMPLPPGVTQIEAPESIVEHVLARMGEPWCFATVFWKASSKAGLLGVDFIKLHLWFWLDTALDARQARAVLRALNERAGLRIADESMADAIQIHYTAAPVFVGMPDPVPRRLGLRRGTVDAVPAALVLPTSTLALPRPRRPAAKAAAPTVRVRGAERALPSGDGAPRRQALMRSSHYAAVLDDVRKLAALRHGGAPLPDGQRDLLFFAAAVAAANVDPAGFEVAVAGLAAEWVPDKDDAWVDAKLVSLRDGVGRHLEGERVEYGGRVASPIYSPSVAWLISFLGVTTAEMASLSVLVSEAVRKRRRRARTPRQVWRAAMADEADWRSVCAIELFEARGLPANLAAEWIGITPRRLRQLVAAHDWDRDYDAPRR